MLRPGIRAILERTAKARAAIDKMIGRKRPKTLAPMVVKRKTKRTRAPTREAALG